MKNADSELIDNTELGTFVRKWMVANNINQSRLAAKLGMHRSVLGDVISRGATPKVATLRRMSVVMDVPMSTLLVEAGYLNYEDLSMPVTEGLDETLAARLAKYPKEFQRAIASQLVPALEKMASALSVERAEASVDCTTVRKSQPNAGSRRRDTTSSLSR